MPEFLGLDKKQWLWIGVAAVGVFGLFLLMGRGGGSSAGAGEAGLPATGPAQLGNMTPAGPSFFDAGEEAAHFFSSRDRFMAQRQAQAADEIPATGLIRGAWEQLASGDWRGVKSDNRGMVLSDADARAIADSNHGPYAHGGKGFFQQAGDAVLSVVRTALPNVAAAYAAGTPITLGTSFLGPKKTPTKNTPPLNPRAPTYGNVPYNAAPGELPEVGGMPYG